MTTPSLVLSLSLDSLFALSFNGEHSSLDPQLCVAKNFSYDQLTVTVLFLPSIPSASLSSFPPCIQQLPGLDSLTNDPSSISSILSHRTSFVVAPHSHNIATPFVSLSKQINCCFVLVTPGHSVTLNLFQQPFRHLVFPFPFISTLLSEQEPKLKGKLSRPNECIFCLGKFGSLLRSFDRCHVSLVQNSKFQIFPHFSIYSVEHLNLRQFVDNYDVDPIFELCKLVSINFFENFADSDDFFVCFSEFSSKSSTEHVVFDLFPIKSDGSQLFLHSLQNQSILIEEIPAVSDLNSSITSLDPSCQFGLVFLFSRDFSAIYLLKSHQKSIKSDLIKHVVLPFLDDWDTEKGDYKSVFDNFQKFFKGVFGF
ncbi:hypothetical protein GEMRC1_003065 [Eukaryota sp. GEM-RC1]